MKLNLQPTLENDLVILRPLNENDFDALYEVAKDPLIWEQHPSSDRYKAEVFKIFFLESIASKGALIIIDKLSTEIIGSSRFQKVEGTDAAIEIGWSFLARKYWGGQYNKSVKQLMLSHAFETVSDVVFYIGRENIRSQKAVQKIGGLRITEAAHKHLMCKSEHHFTYRINKTEWLFKMRIEKATFEQLNEIFQIFMECKRSMEKEKIFQWTEQYPAISHISDDIQNGYLYSLNSEERSLGVINISSVEEPEYKTILWSDKNGRCLVIHRLAVHPKNQKQGLARKLMDFAENFAAENGYTSIRLDAYSGNERVLRFYEKRGYKKRGEVYFSDRVLPFFCYEKEIQN